jgi:hypothetical protein
MQVKDLVPLGASCQDDLVAAPATERGVAVKQTSAQVLLFGANLELDQRPRTRASVDRDGAMCSGKIWPP